MRAHGDTQCQMRHTEITVVRVDGMGLDLGFGASIGSAAGMARLLRLALGILAALTVLGGALYQRHIYGSGGDLAYFYARVHDLLVGHDPYAATAATLHQPLFSLLLSPPALLPLSAAWTLWATLNGLFLLIGAFACTKAVAPRASLALGILIAPEGDTAETARPALALARATYAQLVAPSIAPAVPVISTEVTA
jgi:hypothetical protein